MMVQLLAHQGGWDEALLVAVPALAALWGLRWAGKRAREAAEAREAQESESPENGLDR